MRYQAPLRSPSTAQGASDSLGAMELQKKQLIFSSSSISPVVFLLSVCFLLQHKHKFILEFMAAGQIFSLGRCHIIWLWGHSSVLVPNTRSYILAIPTHSFPTQPAHSVLWFLFPSPALFLLPPTCLLWQEENLICLLFLRAYDCQ